MPRKHHDKKMTLCEAYLDPSAIVAQRLDRFVQEY
jgi:hypothetical protein